ncbi:MAG: sigma-54-dependent Fis family transcriptional regulator [Bdellovibrionaceae bacterium]|nr:sigma-54-dependent Fis family transcriptional regulator [Pseudobdellovibrionaceae bacterium]
MLVLIVHPDASRLKELAQFFEHEGFRVVRATSRQEAIGELTREAPPLIISDIEPAHEANFELIRAAKEVDPFAMVILLAGVGSLEAAIEAVSCGAFDYLTRPFALSDLLATAHRAEARYSALASHSKQNAPVLRGVPSAPKVLVGTSPGMLEVYRAVAKATASDKDVLILGETGTGKELIARAIHSNSRRKSKKFLAINCSSLTDTLLESELFGHEKGAFTGATTDKKGFFEEVDGGTLFLDEIGDISPSLQVKLLRVLQEGEVRRVGSSENRSVDVRVISATHRDLQSLVRKNLFRDDLLYRLRVITVKIPPLRERVDDIEELVYHFLFRQASDENKTVNYVSDEAIALLKAYHWPGNVRELEHAISHAVSMTTTPVLFPEDFPAEILESVKHSAPAELLETPSSAMTLDEVECIHIVRILEAMNFNVSKAAEALGIDRGTLYRKAEKYKISLKKSAS